MNCWPGGYQELVARGLRQTKHQTMGKIQKSINKNLENLETHQTNPETHPKKDPETHHLLLIIPMTSLYPVILPIASYSSFTRHLVALSSLASVASWAPELSLVLPVGRWSIDIRPLFIGCRISSNDSRKPSATLLS